MKRYLVLVVAAALSTLGFFGPSTALADRELISASAIVPPPSNKVLGAQIEGACGVAFRGGTIYVSDYYHRLIYGSPFEIIIPVESPGGPCGLAFDPSGTLYVNIWHDSVVTTSGQTIDSGNESTGVAVDQASGDVYVSDRTFVALYEAPVSAGEEPVRIGEGSLGDAFGVAVFAGRVYAPDAADGTVKVFEPAVDMDDPVMVIDGAETPQGGFNSLVDAAVAVDPTNGHLVVLDNLQPGFEHPEAAIDEFDASGSFLGQVTQRVIDGGPSGLAFEGANLLATNGNSEKSNVFRFGPYVASLPLSLGPPAPAASPQGPFHGVAGGPDTEAAPARAAGEAKASEVVQQHTLRVNFDGTLTPRSLPRQGTAPIRVEVGAKIGTTNGSPPPQLRQIAIAINRNGHLDPGGLPVCHMRDIQPSTTEKALEACRASRVGQGHFSAKVLFAQQAPFPSDGKIVAFNGVWNGSPAILAHVYGTEPVPTSFTLPFLVHEARGTFGTVLSASLPQVTGDAAYVTGLSLSLGRSFRHRGQSRSYLSAGCPAPRGFPGAVFPFARASFGFGRQSLSSTLTRSCRVR